MKERKQLLFFTRIGAHSSKTNKTSFSIPGVFNRVTCETSQAGG